MGGKMWEWIIGVRECMRVGKGKYVGVGVGESVKEIVGLESKWKWKWLELKGIWSDRVGERECKSLWGERVVGVGVRMWKWEWVGRENVGEKSVWWESVWDGSGKVKLEWCEIIWDWESVIDRVGVRKREGVSVKECVGRSEKVEVRESKSERGGSNFKKFFCWL